MGRTTAVRLLGSRRLDRPHGGLPDSPADDADLPERTNHLQPPRGRLDQGEPGTTATRRVGASPAWSASNARSRRPFRCKLAFPGMDERTQREPDAPLPMVPGEGSGGPANRCRAVVGPRRELAPRMDAERPAVRAGGGSASRPEVSP